ncbi:hypothetical protein CK203_072022 [Vitis vinifera]|uniref:Uncharacterized protein n=1 Tax=Vitis vinifera TaxID=29760 RepID=A0A438EXA3_VITVI|nr:hypothetical protein CK203_072022 [Vitis vinifera]
MTLSPSLNHLLITILYTLSILIVNPSSILAGEDSFTVDDIFYQDYSPPAPPPPPPLPPSVSCSEDLHGIGFWREIGLFGFWVFNYCYISGNFSLGENASIVTGAFELSAYNSSLHNGSVVNTTALAGTAPPQTSGTPQGVDGAGGGHGGRGACCLVDKKKLPEDVWGGDAYSWSSLQKPVSFGSKGGTTTKEEDYGGHGGGRVKMEIAGFLVVDGSILADGGHGGSKGGGGSGGSIYIKAYKM